MLFYRKFSSDVPEFFLGKILCLKIWLWLWLSCLLLTFLGINSFKSDCKHTKNTKHPIVPRQGKSAFPQKTLKKSRVFIQLTMKPEEEKLISRQSSYLHLCVYVCKCILFWKDLGSGKAWGKGQSIPRIELSAVIQCSQ